MAVVAQPCDYYESWFVGSGSFVIWNILKGYGTRTVNPTGERPMVDSPALSQISCLSGTAENKGKGDGNFGNKNAIKEEDLDFVRLCKEGGHKGK